MDKNNVSQEELQAEQVELKEVKEDEIRAGIIQEYGFDESVDNERIEKLTAKEVEHRKKMSQAIGQKIKWRDMANKPQPSKQEVKDEPIGNSTTKDLVALMNAKIHDDDVSKVEKWAKYNNISIAEALKTNEMRAILDLSSEQRRTAEATNVGTARRGSIKVSAETLESNARSGKLPESDDEIQTLLKRKMGLDKK